MKIKKGDTIKVLQGKDKGRTGKVVKVLVKEKSVVVENINLFKKHLKPRGEKSPGGIIPLPRPLEVGKVALVCPNCQKPTRVGYQWGKTGEKQRICKKCQALL
jgi:large subunit ribosomal protein L24